MGRWLTPDPLGIVPNAWMGNEEFSVDQQYQDGLDYYEYVRSNSLLSSDWWGLWKPGVHQKMAHEAFKNFDWSGCLTCCADNSGNAFHNGLRKAVVFRDIPGDAKTLMKSHYGNLQWWHSMSSDSDTSAEVVQNRIITNFLQDAENARGAKDCYTKGYQIGIVLHTIQDSYTQSHTARNSAGEITLFQDYSKQDSDKHGTADKEYSKIVELTDFQKSVNASYNLALQSTSELLNLVFCSKASLDEIRNNLLTNYLLLSGDAGVAQTLEVYKPDEKKQKK